MKRNNFILITAMIILVLAAPVWATPVTLDFTDFAHPPLPGGYTDGSHGVSFNFDGLTITAKSMANINNLPFTTGTEMEVFLGNLGTLGTTTTTRPITPPAGYYFGIGVGLDSASAPIRLKDALVLTFSQAQNVSNVHYWLLGTNQNTSGTLAFPADNVRTFIKFASGETYYFDINAGALSPNPLGNPTPDALDWNYWLVYYVGQASAVNKNINALAIEEIGGTTTSIREFGFGKITYDYTPVPEPSILLLMCTGLIGIVGIRRFTK